MVYIYKNEEGVVVYTRESEPSVEHITLERMIPKPVKAGYTAVLNADFQSGKVWFDLHKNPPTLEEVRAEKIAALEAYDQSEAVNIFSLNGMDMWLDKATRVGLVNSLNTNMALGKGTIVLWFGTTKFVLSCEALQRMLIALEAYAMECYNVTAQHKANVLAMEDIDAVAAYNFEEGYPEHPSFGEAPANAAE